MIVITPKVIHIIRETIILDCCVYGGITILVRISVIGGAILILCIYNIVHVIREFIRAYAVNNRSCYRLFAIYG